ncbi:adenylosuccinate synthase [Candidatus Riesia pediculicola]|uniref:Adenylosuccinate synthetase n=1 Tax=Riesia pediculicola (strain USDA) TaxID=515618 RepID=D4G853_RIEPU|nr:adenylosuccinate synthase [Candidatus Riesia pediculicola]ADD79747.1 adenylosuccinate synthetase [Candidatus Riesia pediculicola USDA]ARC53757.1 adenylosuccinate synthetase [Candidatus Riesia pediculicola]QOJ86396.1 adenylosuccinate synthase [Candidatus Riesia pediculicola]
MNRSVVILGVQWGDEGKGKIVDLMTRHSKYVVRYQGGDNAGHTIFLNEKKLVLHTIPSGILYEGVLNLIANGVMISLKSLSEELESLESHGIDAENRLAISGSCFLVLPHHVAIDRARERREGSKIGTTLRGMGPAYEDKVARRGLKLSDIFHVKYFQKRLKEIIDFHNFHLVHYYHSSSIDYQKTLEETLYNSKRILKIVKDVSEILHKAHKRSEPVIYEGAQGAMLDIDQGTYPYVTSSNTTSGGVSLGSGIGPKRCIGHVLGVVKAYSTRVGLGPFPTEINGPIGKYLRKRGMEYGSTTGRPRRVGWIDILMIKKSIECNSISSFCLTKLDVLDGVETIKICVSYQNKQGKRIYTIPSSSEDWKNIEPIYEILPGWKRSLYKTRDYCLLPKEAISYVNRIEELTGISVCIISTGPSREDSIIIKNPFHR